MSEPKPKLPRSVLILNIIMIVLILAICALVVNLVYSPSILGEQTTVSTQATTVSDAETQTQEAEASATSQDTTSVSMTKRSTSDGEDPSGASGDLPEYEELGYSKESFKNDLFIGDSIVTGFHLYNKLDTDNIAASVGYTPYKAYSENCDFHEATAVEYASSMKPDRIYIMLGSNGLPYVAAMKDSYDLLIDKLKAACPNSEIYCISVTPVGENADTDVTNEMVNEFNDVIKSICKEKSIEYFDFYSEMMGNDGYADPDLLAQDGVHFNSTTYDILLKYIEDSVS